MPAGRVEPRMPGKAAAMNDWQPLAWQNGRQRPLAEAAVPVWDLGVVAGASISEMARTYGLQPFRVRQHLARLEASCRELGFALPYSSGDLEQAAADLVKHNSHVVGASSDLGIVWFVTAGANRTYLADADAHPPTVCVHTFELPFSAWQTAVESGMRLTIPQQHQLPADSFPVQHKTRNRLHWLLADRAAAERRPGSRALLTDSDNHLTETSTSCFYAVVDDIVVTPRRGVLRSVTRNMVRELCDRIGLRFREADLAADRIAEFQETFVSSTPCGLLPVASIEDHCFPGHRGPVLQLLLQEWSRLTGVDTFQQILQAS